MCENFEVCILSQGERLKNLRKSLGLKQAELSGNNITRNMISMIENNKAPLTIKASKLIYNNLMESCKRRGLKYETSPEEIYLTEEDQVRRIGESYSNYLKKNKSEEFKNFHGFENFDEIMDYINKYKVNDCKMKIYYYVGRYYQFKLDYDKAFRYLSIVNELVLTEVVDSKFIGRLVGVILDVTKNSKRYEEGLLISDRLMNRVDSSYMSVILYNRVIILKTLGKIEDALTEINKLEELYSSNTLEYRLGLQIGMYIVKANCLRELNQNKQATNIYFELIENIVWNEENIHFKALLLTNIIETYLETGEDYLKYLEKLDNLVEDIPDLDNRRFICELYKHVYEAYDNLKDDRYNKLKDKYLKKMIKASMKFKIHEILSFALNKLLDDAKVSEDEEKIESVKEDIFNGLKNGLLKLDSFLVFNLIEYYNSANKNDKISEIISFIRSLNDEGGFEDA